MLLLAMTRAHSLLHYRKQQKIYLGEIGMKQMDETVASRTERGGNAGRGDGKISWYKIGAVENWLIKGACIQ